MTADERIRSLHARMAALQRKRELRKTAIIGTTCAALTLCLIFMIFSGGGMYLGGVAGLYSGATMLFEGAGAYVLVAIIAFMAGVIVTVVIQRHKRREQNQVLTPTEQNKEKQRGELL